MARWTAVQDRLTFGSGTTQAQRITDVRALLGLPSSMSDAVIALRLNSALADADEFLGNPFHQRDWEEDSSTFGQYVDPAVELAIPPAVSEGVLLQIDLALNGRVGSLISVAVGSWQKQYRSNPEEIRQKIREEYWAKFRLTPGF